MLVFAAGLVSGADAGRLEIVAAAVELIHAYSLVHDDLPCMDDDVLRRGKPTCHVEFDEATALLAGDALQSLAFQLLAEHRLADDPGVQLQMIQLFAVACGSRGMAGGQAIDLDAVGKSLTLPELENMHIHKTGALIRASVLLGAHCGAAPRRRHPGQASTATRSAWASPSRWSTTSSTRKAIPRPSARPPARTGRPGKPTYTSLLGIPGAKQFAADLLADAHGALAAFDARADRLRELADFIVQRDR